MGETDPLNADSDGDGLLDGAEDINRNGFRDANETDPNLFDTDGDGLNDAEDSQPLVEFLEPQLSGSGPLDCDCRAHQSGQGHWLWFLLLILRPRREKATRV